MTKNRRLNFRLQHWIDLDLKLKNYEFDVNCRKFNITLLMASAPVFLVSATYREQIS